MTSTELQIPKYYQQMKSTKLQISKYYQQVKMMVPDEWLPIVVSVGNATLLCLITSHLATFFGFLIYGNAQSSSLFVSVRQKPKEVHQRILLVCKYYSLGISLMILTSLWACNSSDFQNFVKSHNLLHSIGTTITIFLSMLFIHSFSYKEKYYPKLFFFIMHSFLTAPAVCSLGGELCLKTAFYSVQLIIILIIVALTAHESFHQKIVDPVSKINGVVTAASICVSIIGTPKSGFEIFLLCLNLHLGFIFFAWIFVINIQMFVMDTFLQDENFDPIYIAAVLQVSSLNLFLRTGTLLTLTAAYKNYRNRETASK